MFCYQIRLILFKEIDSNKKKKQHRTRRHKQTKTKQTKIAIR